VGRENSIENEQQADEPRREGRGLTKVIAFAVGTVVLILLFYFIGFDAVLQPLSQIGWGFVFIVVLNGMRHYLRAINLYIAVPKNERNFSIKNAFSARLAGEAINTVAFTGPVLGDAAKAAMLNRKVSLEHSATAVIIDEVIYYISSLLMILFGAMVILYVHGSTGTLINITLIGLVAFSVLAFIGLWLIIKYEITPISWLITKVGHWKFFPRSLKRKSESVKDVELNVLKFYDERRRAFLIITAIILVTHALSVGEAYWSMRMLGFDLFVNTAFIIESLTKAVNFIFFLIPGTIGAYEGGNSIILKLLGYSAGAGIALAFVRRGGIIFWTLVGGGILIWRGAKKGVKELEDTVAEAE
jgi:hypothetical protein